MSSASVAGLKVLEVDYSVRLGYVIFPLDFRDLMDALVRNGYELPTPTRPLPPRPTRVGGTGTIARKGEYEVRVNTDMGVIGIHGKSLDATMDAFEELCKVISNELHLDLEKNVRLYMINAHYNLDTGKNPCDQIARVTGENPYFAKFDEILGRQISLFSIRLMPKGKIPNQEEWFDISIEPDILKVGTYYIHLIFRNPDKKKSMNFIKSLEKTLIKLVEAIEGEK